MGVPRIPEEEDLVFIPNFYENVVFSYRVVGTPMLYEDERVADVCLYGMLEKAYQHSEGIIKHLYYNIDEGKFFLDIQTVPDKPVNNAEPPNLISIRKYIPAFEEKPDAWEFLERNQASEHNFERRQTLLEIRALLYKQLESTGDTRLFWKYIDYASSDEKMRNEIIYLLNEEARLVFYIPEGIKSMYNVEAIRRIKDRRIASLNTIYNMCIGILPINMVVIANSLTPEWMSKTKPKFTGDNDDCRSMVLPPQNCEWKLLCPDCMDEKFPKDIAPNIYKLIIDRPYGICQTYYRYILNDTFPDMRQMFCFVEPRSGGEWR